jgi:hypothetical protein
MFAPPGSLQAPRSPLTPTPAARVRTSFTPVRTEADRVVAAHMNPLM